MAEKEEIVLGEINLEDITGEAQTFSPVVESEKDKKKNETVKKLEDTFSLGESLTFDQEEEDTEEKADKEKTKTEEVKTVKEVENDSESDFTKEVKKLIKKGLFEDFEVSEGVNFSEFEGEITKEEYEEILKNQESWKKEKLEDDLLSSLEDEEREFIEFKKNGGNLDDFVATYNYKKQAQNLEIETDSGKKRVIYAYYKNFVGWDDNRILKFIDREEKDLGLDDEAKRAYDFINKQSEQAHQQTIKQQEELQKKQQELDAQYKEQLKDSLKKEGVDSKKVQTIVKAYTEKDERGLTEVDKMYISLRNNPEKTNLLFQLLSNPEGFLEEKKKNIKNDTKLEEVKKIMFRKPKVTSERESQSTDRFKEIFG
jgi:hypothetical protein